MKARIELYRNSEYDLVLVVNIYGIVKEFTTERGAHNYLSNQGFDYNFDEGYYEKKRYSKSELKLKQQYTKVIV